MFCWASNIDNVEFHDIPVAFELWELPFASHGHAIAPIALQCIQHDVLWFAISW